MLLGFLNGTVGEAPPPRSSMSMPRIGESDVATVGAAVLLVDVINDFEIVGREHLLQQFAPAAERIAAMKAAAKGAGVPIVYVNDNFGQWRSDFRTIIDEC